MSLVIGLSVSAAHAGSGVRVEVLQGAALNGVLSGQAKVRTTTTAEDGTSKVEELSIPDGAVYETQATGSGLPNLRTPIARSGNPGEQTLHSALPPDIKLGTIFSAPQCDVSRLSNWNDVPQPEAAAIAARDSRDPYVIAAYMSQQYYGGGFSNRRGLTNSLAAFSGVQPQDMSALVLQPANEALFREFSTQILNHQEWYEPLVSRLTLRLGKVASIRWPTPPVQFSQEQLTALRAAFIKKDGLILGGNLLLAYPDRLERNEKMITQQYYDISIAMGSLIGNEADWATFATWASDTVGRSIGKDFLVDVAETAGSNPRYWLSKGNAQLASQLPVAYVQFIQTFKNGANRQLSFEEFWSRLVKRYSGYGVTYIDGDEQSKRDAKNAFKAYYDSMKLYDEEKTLRNSYWPWDVKRRMSLRETRGQYMLYGNVMTVLTEQRLPATQTALNNGQCIGGVINPIGAASAIGVIFHLPGWAGIGDKPLPAILGLPLNTLYRVYLNRSFVTSNGASIDMGREVKNLLNGLRTRNFYKDKYLPIYSATAHWEDLGERMAYIFHMFANFQRYSPIYSNPRKVYGSRAGVSVNNPIIEYALLP